MTIYDMQLRLVRTPCFNHSFNVASVQYQHCLRIKLKW